MMNQANIKIRPINDSKSYQEALDKIDLLFDASPGTPKGDVLDVLVTLVEAYEKREFRFPNPDPVEAIKYQMEKLGLSRRDLKPFIGTRARVSEILNKKRKLTISMIRNLEAGLSIPAEILIRDYEVEEKNEATHAWARFSPAMDDAFRIFFYLSPADYETLSSSEECHMPRKETVRDCYVNFVTKTFDSVTEGMLIAEEASSIIDSSSDANLRRFIYHNWTAPSKLCDESIVFDTLAGLVSEEAVL